MTNFPNMPVVTDKNEQLLKASIAVNAAIWAKFTRIILANGKLFNFDERPYQIEPLLYNFPRVCYMKATGGGFSEVEILKTIHGLIYGRYSQGALYLFPTNDDVQDYSKSRFNPLFSNNYQTLGRYMKVGAKGTDTTKLKIINGKNLYLRGARLDPSDEGTGAKSSTKLSGIQVDRVVFDEIDQMDDEALEKARQRRGNAEIDGVKGANEESDIANPSDEDRGIDLIWQICDQREWFRKCSACGEWTCAEIEFMNDPEKCVGTYGVGENSKGYIRCKKCGKPVSLGVYNPGKPDHSGEWRAQKPLNKTIAGFHWSHLSSIYHDPAVILDKFRNPPEGNLGDVYRLDLGLPYSSKEDKLRKDTVLSCCGNDIMLSNHAGPCAMGVDVGKTWHVVIGIRTGNDKYEIIKVCQADGLNTIHDLAFRYNVKSAVLDIRPYEDSCRKFQKEEHYRVFLCEYTDSPLQEANFNDSTGVVKAYRTGIFDATHRLITNGQLRIPRQCPAIEEFARQCCNCVKTRDVRRKDAVVYRYIATGDKAEHYRHALNYFVLAASSHRIATAKSPFSAPTEPQFVINENSRYI